MERAAIEQHLAEAERHVTQSEGLVRRQREVVQQLERDGHDTALAKVLLSELERSLALHRLDCKRTREQLERFRHA